MRRRRGTLFIVLAVALYACVLWYVNASKPVRPLGAAGSSSSVVASGSIAMAELWNRLGQPFQPWAQVPGLLPDSNDVFVSVAPEGSQYHPRETKDLLRWVRAGHDAVWASAVQDPVISYEGLSLRPASQSISRLAITRHGQAVSSSIQTTVRQGAYLQGSTLAHALMTVRSRDGVVAAELQVGRGHLWVCALPSLFYNDVIGRSDNFRIVWLMVGNRGVMWDEYGHGVVAQSLLQATFSQGRQWSLVWFLIAAVAFVWLASTRFGRPELDISEQTRHQGEWLHALAYQLSRSTLRSLREELIRDNLQRRLGRELGLLSSASDLQRHSRELWRMERSSDEKLT